MNVRRFENPHVKRVEAVLEDMLKRTRAGRIPSVLFIAEEIGRAQPHYGIVGRFRADPAKAIGHMAIMTAKVTDFAADQVPSIDDHE